MDFNPILPACLHHVHLKPVDNMYGFSNKLFAQRMIIQNSHLGPK